MGSREERGLSRRYTIGEGASHINSIYGSLSTLFPFPVNIYYMILSLRDSEVKKTVKVSQGQSLSAWILHSVQAACV